MPTQEQYRERQHGLADFGELALRSDDLQEVLTEACRMVSRALDTDFAKVLQAEPDDTLLVRAGIGWEQGIVGEMRFPTHDQTSEGLAMREVRPVLTRNIHEETSFDFPSFMKEAGVVAVVNVPIRLPGGEPYGLLQVDSREPRDFDKDDIEFLRTYAGVLGPVIDRLHKVHSLAEALEKHQRLLRELEHRIKNNIGVIRSLINSKAHEANSQETKAALVSVGQRVETLRLVHEQLYSTGEVDRLPLRPYITKLVHGLRELHAEDESRVALHLDIDEIELATDTALPLGLIVNEVVTNSFKYAFDGKRGTLDVRIAGGAKAKLRMRIADDGKGMAAVVDGEHQGTGLKMIKGLSRQIGGEAGVSSTSEGTIVEIEFPQQ